MADNVDIEFVIDENRESPKVTVYAKEKTEQTQRIIAAVMDASATEDTGIPAYSDGKLSFIPQKDIMRVRTEGRQIVLDTEERYYIVKQTLTNLEKELNGNRFIRISQSEIINIFKVRQFDVSLSGTIGVEFKNGVKTYASRRYMKAIKAFLNGKEGLR